MQADLLNWSSLFRLAQNTVTLWPDSNSSQHTKSKITAKVRRSLFACVVSCMIPSRIFHLLGKGIDRNVLRIVHSVIPSIRSIKLVMKHSVWWLLFGTNPRISGLSHIVYRWLIIKRRFGFCFTLLGPSVETQRCILTDSSQFAELL